MTRARLLGGSDDRHRPLARRELTYPASMSEAVRAALAARRAAATRQRQQLTSAAGAHPIGAAADDDIAISVAQPPLARALLASTSSGRLTIAARSPPLTSMPPDVWALAEDGPEPLWHEGAPEPWYARVDIASLNASSNELVSLDDRIGLFRALERLELHHNLLASIPLAVLGLEHLTVVSLANNCLAAFPTALLALDHLHTLDLSGNQLSSLWSASDVLAARSEQKHIRHNWEAEHGPVDEDGIWTAFLSAPNSPIKRNQAQLPPEVPLPPTVAMRKLRVLKLARNRLTNRSLGIGRKASEGGETNFVFPPRLRLLDLGRNNLRAPLAISAFAGLNQLQELHLDHTGMWDQVFAQPEKDGQDGDEIPNEEVEAALPALSVLTLDATDMNDLRPIEQQFSSAPTLTSAPAAAPKLEQATPWLAPKQIVRMRGSEKPPLNAPDGLVYLTLDGCPLVEERMRHRRAPATRQAPVPVASPMASGAGRIHHSPTRRPSGAKDSDEFGPLGSARHKRQDSPPHAEPAAEEFEPLGTPTRSTRRGRALVLSPVAGEAGALGLTPSPSRRARARPDPAAAMDEFGPLGGLSSPHSTPSNAGQPASPAPASLEPSKPDHTVRTAPDDWAALAEQAPLTPGQQRMMRAAAARRERERLATEQA